MGNCISTYYRRKWAHKTITLALVGLDNAGKTTLCSILAGEEPDPCVVPTVGFRSVRFCHRRFDVTLFDLGGGESIRAIWTSYFMEVFGVLFVLDSSCPSRLCEARQVFEETVRHTHICGKPILVIANKTDKEEHLSEADIMAGLGLDSFSNCPLRMVMISTMQPSRKKKLQTGLDWLLDMIQKLMVTLEPRVMEDTRVAHEARDRQREERRLRIKQLNEERELDEEKERAQLGVRVAEDSEDDIVFCGDPFKPVDVEQLKMKEQLLQEKKQLKQQRIKELVTHDDDDDVVVVGENVLRPNTGNSQVDDMQHMTGTVGHTGNSQVDGMQYMTETEQEKQHIGISTKQKRKKIIFFRSNKVAPYNNNDGYGTAPISERHVGTAPISERHVGTAPISERHVGTASISERHVGAAPISERHAGTTSISERHVNTASVSERYVGTAHISESDNSTAAMSGLGCTMKYTSPATHSRNAQFTSIMKHGPDVDSMFSGKSLPPVEGYYQNSRLKDMHHDDDGDVVF